MINNAGRCQEVCESILPMRAEKRVFKPRASIKDIQTAKPWGPDIA